MAKPTITLPPQASVQSMSIDEAVTRLQLPSPVVDTLKTKAQPDEITFADLQVINANNMLVEDLPHWFIIPSAKLSESVPAFFQPASRDVEGVDTPYTWQDWFDAGNNHNSGTHCRIAGDSMGQLQDSAILTQITDIDIVVLNRQEAAQWNIDNIEGIAP